MKPTYSKLLRDPRWQKRRLSILNRDNFTCNDCKSQTKELHVHHVIYEKGVLPWNYDASGLMTLCEECHPIRQHRQNALLLATRDLAPRILQALIEALEETDKITRNMAFGECTDFLLDCRECNQVSDPTKNEPSNDGSVFAPSAKR